MQHVDQATLDAVLNHQLSDAQLAKIKEHVRGCRMCARRLEEYRDLFSEVEVIIPTAERNRVSKPGVGRTWRDVLTPRLDDALPSSDRMLKIGMAAVTVLVLGVVVFLMRSPSRSVAPIVLAPHPQVTAPTASAPQPTSQVTQPAPAPTRAVNPAPTAPAAAAPVRTTAETPPLPRRQKPVTDPPQRAAVATPVAPDNSHTPLFHRVESTEAIGALGGSMRLIDGVTPDHFEMAPGTVVPGAAETLPVIRVVYRLYGGTILLDQQRNPEQASRDSASGTAPEGVSVLRWSSGDFWLTLAGRVPADSLELLARRVK
jgi:hypothetical protein